MREIAVDTVCGIEYNDTMNRNIRKFQKSPLFRVFQGVLFVAGLALLVYITDVGCLFRHVLGVPCPGCGTTRAWLAFLSGGFGEAFWYHPLFWLTPILLAVGFWNPKWLSGKWGNRAALLFLVLYLLLYAARMVLCFPTQPPMEFFSDAVLPRMLRWFSNGLK